MRRINETHRVLGLVAVAVTVGLSVAGFANGSADAHGGRLARQPDRAAADAAGAPARNVRVVYGGSIGGRTVTAEQPPRPKPANPAADQPSAQSSERPAAAASVIRPDAVPVRMASRDEKPPRLEETFRGRDGAKPGVDLNAASIEELNTLGGGRIGKAIARSRPYKSPEDLLSKRVINRATFARIKDHVKAE